ncbi:MAG TPA: c-type cytochrome [Polyangiaceae bacterium]|jgi:mono/diheme cytochrome c family protein|nr:c-type cytochrome [Polyangiaceae bacterium]
MGSSFVSFRAFLFVTPVLAGALLGCSSSSDAPAGGGSGATGLAIVPVSAPGLTAAGGDALALKVVNRKSDGTTEDVPAAQVTWSGPPTVTATDPSGMAAASAYPATGGAGPVAVWIANAPRADHASDLAGVLFILDAGASGGSVSVTATVSGGGGGTATASVTVSATPAGDATRGAALYGASGAACAACHGATGHGSPDSADNGTTFSIDGTPYAFPAPGLNAEDGNAAAEWSPELFAIAARADLDDEAVSLRQPMPDWLTAESPGSGKALTTQDLADIFAFLATQKQ